MKRAFLFLLGAALLAIVVAPVQAQDLTKSDRAALVNYLKETRNGVETATKGLTDEQLKFKPAPDRWSIAECMEHIAAAEDYLFDLVSNKVMKTAGLTEPFDLAKAHEIDAKVKAGVTDRSQKAQAPEPLVPTNRFGSPQGSWKHFVESRKRTIEFVQNENGLRARVMDSPVAKNMDAYQWVLFLSAHSARHTAQILEVRRDPNFPKK